MPSRCEPCARGALRGRSGNRRSDAKEALPSLVVSELSVVGESGEVGGELSGGGMRRKFGHLGGLGREGSRGRRRCCVGSEGFGSGGSGRGWLWAKWQRWRETWKRRGESARDGLEELATAELGHGYGQDGHGREIGGEMSWEIFASKSVMSLAERMRVRLWVGVVT